MAATDASHPTTNPDAWRPAPPAQAKQRRAGQARLAASAGVALAFAMRLYRLGAESLWYDELVSVDLARAPIADLINQTARDIHPPGYYLVLHLWQWISGPVMELGYGFEFLYAFPSAGFGVLVCGLIYWLAKRYFNAPVALLALFLAALHPFQIEYSQEVRMYTLGAALCLLYVGMSEQLVFTRAPDIHAAITRRRWIMAARLGVVTAAGLYTFYYFGFLIAGAGLSLVAWWLFQPKRRLYAVRGWLGAQGLALVLWLPWLPTFVRQAIDPPVPPWREGWEGIAATLNAVSAVASVYTAGHGADRSAWAGGGFLIIGMALALYGYTQRSRLEHHMTPANPSASTAILSLILFALGPPLLLILLSATVTPLFHPRYVYVFHAPFLILAALGLTILRGQAPRLGMAATLVALALAVGGAAYFWNDPASRADDHRGAVARVAHAWRPGDAILVNAGWAYRAFSVYWPTVQVYTKQQSSNLDALPPTLGPRLRLDPQGLDDEALRNTLGSDSVPLFYTGSLDGPRGLGWNAPEADFFAVSAAATLQALNRLGAHATAIHHYRIYDTVNDPTAVIRAWLEAEGELITAEPIPGRDFLRVEHYRLDPKLQSPAATSGPAGSSIHRQTFQFDDRARVKFRMPTTPVEAGRIFYLPIAIDMQADGDPLGASLRLVDQSGRVAVQSDTPLPQLPHLDAPGAPFQAAMLAIPLAAALPPVEYTLHLVIYDQATLAPLAPDENATAAGAANLGAIRLLPATFAPVVSGAVARFDYMDLLSVTSSPDIAADAEHWDLELVWYPRPSPYQDNYSVIVAWLPSTASTAGSAGAVTWRATIGPPDYPSGLWAEGYPVRRLHQLALPDELSPGNYIVRVSMRRTSDDAVIPARTLFGLQSAEWATVGEVTVYIPQP